MAYVNMEDVKKIQEIIPKIQSTYDKFIYENNLYLYKNTITLAIIIGGTGSGKSTFLNLLSGQKLIIKEIHDCLVLEAPNQNISKISHDFRSETGIPNLWYDKKHNIVFCDCPGFFDTKGPVQETINILAIVTLLNFTKRAKIILMVSQDDSIALKGQITCKQFDIIESLSRVKLSESGICMVLTKAEKKLKKENQLKIHLSKMGAFEEKNQLLNRVINDSRKRVFIFPEPPEDSEENSQYNEFTNEDINQLIRFIKDENDMFQSSDKAPLSEASLHFILSLINNSSQIDNLIQQIISHLKYDCESQIQNSAYSIRKWKNNINNIKNFRYYTMNQLISKLKENFNSYKYTSIYHKIEQIQLLIPILVKIDSSKLKNGNAQAYRNFINSTSIYNVKTVVNEGLEDIMRIIKSEENRIEKERQRQEEERRRIQEEIRRRKALERQRQIEERRREEERRRRIEEKRRLEEEQRQLELEQKRIQEEQEKKRAQRERELALQRKRKRQEQLRIQQQRKQQVRYVHHYSSSSDDGCNIF